MSDITDRLVGSALSNALRVSLPRIKKLADTGAAHVAAHFGCALILTRAVFFGSSAPLGVAFAAASCRKRPFAAALGAMIGYLFLKGPAEGIKYAAAVLLCLSASLIFRDTVFGSMRTFAPFIAAVSLAGTGFVFVGKDTSGILMFISEIALCTSAAWLFSAPARTDDSARDAETALSAPAGMRSAEFAILCFAILASLADITAAGGISPARAAAVMLVLYIARRGGAGAGASAGLLAGLMMDMRAAAVPHLALTSAFSGLAAGALAPAGRLAFTAAAVAAGGAAAIWTSSSPLTLPGLFETFIASVVFIMLPVKPMERKAEHFPVKTACEFAAGRITAASEAFRDIYSVLQSSVSRQRNEEDMRVVFDDAAERVCKGCVIRSSCWEHDYVSTFSALSGLMPALMRTGYAERSDYPPYFASRCINFPQFTGAVNDAATALLKRRQHRARMSENGNVIKQQYAGVAAMLDRVAKDVADAPDLPDSETRAACAAADQICSGCETVVWRAREGRRAVSISGKGTMPQENDADRIADVISEALGRTFFSASETCTADGWRLLLHERPTLRTNVGVGARKKKGEDVSGDCGTYFCTPEGMAYIILSDGMGAGHGAAAASASAVKLIERFLRAGVSPREALAAAWPALKIRGDERGFATIDIMSVDLHSGVCESVKCGAADSFLRIGGRVSLIRGASLPPGVSPGDCAPTDAVTAKLSDGDMILIVSDGVTSAIGEDAIRGALLEADASNPRTLARALMDEASKDGPSDDVTAVAAAIMRNTAGSC